MTIGERIEERLQTLGMSQSELARRVSLRQSSINSLIRGNTRASRHLHEIARELRTTTAYLAGEIDDPEEGAALPPASPAVQYVQMTVAMPNEAALTAMFQALLRILPEDATEKERAQILARRLPSALGQLRDLAP